MKTFTANEAKTNFGELLLSSQREPVSVTKNGKPAAVMLSQQDFEAMANAAQTLASHEQFPQEQTDFLSRILTLSDKQFENGEYEVFNGSLKETLTSYKARKQNP